MSKKSELSDLPGLGPKLEEKLKEAGIKTVLNLSRAKADKLAEKVDGLSESRAATLIAAAQEVLGEPAPKKKEAKPKKKEAKEEKPKAKPKKKAEAKAEKPKTKAEAKPKAAKKAKAEKPKAKPKKKKDKLKVETPARFLKLDARLIRIAANKKKRKPQFRADQAHRWTRVSDRWRKVRGIDSYTRQKKKGRIAMVSPGYRSPKSIRYLHPSMFEEVLVHRPSDLEGLDADIHAIRIGGSVGSRKRQLIIAEADAKLLRVLNPGTTEEIGEEDLFTDLDLED